MVRVKICGITREEDVKASMMAGADAVGFIVGFPSSPRNLTLERAGELISHVGPFVDAVLVTTAEVTRANPEKVRSIRPDAIQIYGDSIDVAQLRRVVPTRLIRAYPLRSSDMALAKQAAEGFDALLIDSHVAGMHGGTGKTADWGVCAEIRSTIDPVPLVLSGGLNPQNVEEAVKRVRPFAVDVSSGVEGSPGVKDHHKVSAFIRTAKGAD